MSRIAGLLVHRFPSKGRLIRRADVEIVSFFKSCYKMLVKLTFYEKIVSKSSFFKLNVIAKTL